MKLYDLHSIPFEFEQGGVLPFATMAALGAYDDAAISEGGLVWVESFRDYCQKIVESPAPAAVDAMVVPTATGDGGWYRLGIASPSWRAQATWYINSATGDDENEGTVAAPLATFAEFARSAPVLSQDTLVYQVDDTTEVFTGRFAIAPGSDAVTLSIQGVPDVLTLGTITTVSAPNPASATNLPGVLTASDLTPAPIDWIALDGVGKLVVETTNGTHSGYATVVIDSTGGTTAYTPEWTMGELGYEVPTPGDAIRVLGLRTVPSMKIVAEGVVVGVKYIHLTDTTTFSSLACAPFLWDGAALQTSYFDCCWLDCPFDATSTWLTKFQASILDADAGSFTLFGTGAARWIGAGIDGDFTLSSGVTLFADGTVVRTGSFRIAGENSDSTSTRPQLTIGSHGLGIFGSALTTTGLNVVSADVYVGGPLYGKTHLRGLAVSRGGAVSIKSTLVPTTHLTLTGTTELAITTPNGIGAGLVVPIVAGIPTGAGAALATWANWATLNRQAINFGDLTRIVGIA